MLTVYTIEQANQWDLIVRSFREYDTYWLSGYVKAFQLHGDGEPLLLYFESDETRGINVVMKRDIAANKHFAGRISDKSYYDFATPYGYGGWIIEGSEKVELFAAYETWCLQNGIISEFVRFHPMLKNHKDCRGFYEVEQLGEVVHMDLSSPELIWENLMSQNRNKIRKAVKNGVKIYNCQTPEIYETFRHLYVRTMDKVHAEEYYYFGIDFYKSILNDLPDNAQVFYAAKDEIVIAASIVLMANSQMNYHFSGSLQEYNWLAPTNLLLYEIALWGHAHGYKALYLGGGVGSKADSLLAFKRSFFKKELDRFFVGKKIFDKAKYDELLSLRTDKVDNGFFPEYRA